MKSTIEHKLQAAVVRLLKPLVRILLRNGIPVGVLEELVRWTYVEVAFQESSLPGRKLTDSRVSIVTGLSRKEVSRLKNIAAPEDNEAGPRFSRVARIIGGWLRDPRFLGMDGQPANLPLESPTGSFAELVRSYGGDVPTRAAYDELTRVGAIAQAEDGSVKLTERGYVPAEGLSEKIELLGTDVSDLISTIDHNLDQSSSSKWYQRKVAYDNIPAETAQTFQVQSAEQAQKLLEDFDRFLAAQDRDLNPHRTGTGRKRVGVGIYYFEEDMDQAAGKDKPK